MLHRTPRVIASTDPCSAAGTLRELFESEESALLCYAFSLVGRRAVAEEIVQEVFLQLHIKWKTVEHPRAWLYRSVRNRVFNHMRDNRYEVTESISSATQNVSDTASPASVALHLEAIQTLYKSIASLGDSDRQLIQLKYFDGLKYREISEITGLSVGNVGYRLHHLLKDLAKKLHSLGMDGNP